MPIKFQSGILVKKNSYNGWQKLAYAKHFQPRKQLTLTLLAVFKTVAGVLSIIALKSYSYYTLSNFELNESD